MTGVLRSELLLRIIHKTIIMPHENLNLHQLCILVDLSISYALNKIKLSVLVASFIQLVSLDNNDIVCLAEGRKSHVILPNVHVNKFDTYFNLKFECLIC